MNITLYQRSFPVEASPVTWSLVPFTPGQMCTFPAGGRVYEATYTEVRVIAPGEAKVDGFRNRVMWNDGKGRIRSTAREVYDLAHAGDAGFRLAG